MGECDGHVMIPLRVNEDRASLFATIAWKRKKKKKKKKKQQQKNNLGRFEVGSVDWDHRQNGGGAVLRVAFRPSDWKEPWARRVGHQVAAPRRTVQSKLWATECCQADADDPG